MQTDVPLMQSSARGFGATAVPCAGLSHGSPGVPPLSPFLSPLISSLSSSVCFRRLLSVSHKKIGVACLSCPKW